MFVVELLKTTGIKAEHMDEFASHVVWPKSKGKISATFFRTKINKPSKTNGQGPKLTGFANDTLFAIDVIALFVALSLRPMGVLPVHAEHAAVLHSLTKKLLYGSGPEQLEQQLEQHHKLFYHCFHSVQNRNCTFLDISQGRSKNTALFSTLSPASVKTDSREEYATELIGNSTQLVWQKQ